MTNEDRFNQIERLAESNSRAIAELRESQEQTNRNIDILVGIVTGHQERFATVIEEIRDMKEEIRDMKAEIRGLQTENRRILQILSRLDANEE